LVRRKKKRKKRRLPRKNKNKKKILKSNSSFSWVGGFYGVKLIQQFSMHPSVVVVVLEQDHS